MYSSVIVVVRERLCRGFLVKKRSETLESKPFLCLYLTKSVFFVVLSVSLENIEDGSKDAYEGSAIKNSTLDWSPYGLHCGSPRFVVKQGKLAKIVP